jgi:hypothetical protein
MALLEIISLWYFFLHTRLPSAPLVVDGTLRHLITRLVRKTASYSIDRCAAWYNSFGDHTIYIGNEFHLSTKLVQIVLRDSLCPSPPGMGQNQGLRDEDRGNDADLAVVLWCLATIRR